MALRRQLVFVCAAAVASMGASSRTQNFLVEAPTPQVAQQVGQLAEFYRREKALQWLGREMPPWPEPCPLHVKVTMGGAGGATSFAFDHGRVLGQHMNIEGALDRLLASVLPHEVTHTVFAHHFRCPVPRWADEGGAVLSEDDVEKNRHDQLVRNILNTPGRAIPLRRLFSLREYPGDVMVLYAEVYSVAQFLVDRSSRPAFLNFVAQGMQQGWDSAVRTHYQFNSVEELEQTWLAHLRATKRQPGLLARNTGPTPADPANRVIVRQTVPPAQPLLSAPVFRGQAPTPEQEGQRFGDPPAGRPGYLPDVPASGGVPRDPWQPAGTSAPPPPEPPTVRLGTPQPVTPETPRPQWRMPVGYPQ